MVVKIVLTFFLLIIIPFLVGNSVLICYHLKKSIKFRFIYGWIFLLAIFEVLVVPMTFLGESLTGLTWIYCSIVLTMGVITSVWCWLKKDTGIKQRNSRLHIGRINIYGIISIGLLAVQLIVAVFGVHMDADDAYYIGTANTSIATDTLFVVEPDTGMPYETLPLRYAFSALMIFWAYLSKLTGIHPLIIAHSIIPVLFILISYLLWWELGNCLFDTTDKKWIFFLFVNLLNIFGNTSVYTQSSFLLFRIWQGKAMLPNIIFPALLVTFLSIYEKPQEKKNWLIIITIVIAGCCCSSMAVPLGIMVVVSGCLILAIKLKDWKTLIYGAMCCIPCLLIGLAYLVLQ